MSEGSLILIPNILCKAPKRGFEMSEAIFEQLQDLDGLIIESKKGAVPLLKHLKREPDLYYLDDYRRPKDRKELIQRVYEGKKMGLISDAGYPCVADPGADLVLWARQKGLVVELMPGQSSLFMALALSGLGGQNFSFHGYLPRKTELLQAKVKELIAQKGVTHLFIETPYRNKVVLGALIKMLPKNALLSVASQLSSPEEKVVTRRVHKWEMADIEAFHKQPAIFLFKEGSS